MKLYGMTKSELLKFAKRVFKGNLINSSGNAKGKIKLEWNDEHKDYTVFEVGGNVLGAIQVGEKEIYVNGVHWEKYYKRAEPKQKNVKGLPLLEKEDKK